jgi:hypothetical protein
MVISDRILRCAAEEEDDDDRAAVVSTTTSVAEAGPEADGDDDFDNDADDNDGDGAFLEKKENRFSSKSEPWPFLNLSCPL